MTLNYRSLATNISLIDKEPN